MSSEDIHSVILNFNKNFSNSKGYNFRQIINNQLELKPNSMIALYSGNIVRKPIVVPEDTYVTFNLTSMLPSLSMVANINSNTLDTIDSYGFDVLIPSGTFSTLTFCRAFCEKVNEYIGTNLDLQDSDVLPPFKKSFPYRCHYDMKDGQFYLGLRYHLNPETTNSQFDNFQVAFLDLNDGCNTSQAITFSKFDEQIVFNRTAKAYDWNSYALGNQPIKSMSYCYTDDGVDDKLGYDVSFSSCQIQYQLPVGGNDEMDFLFALNNTYFASEWADQSPPNVSTSNIVISPVEIPIPQCLIGAYIHIEADTSAITKQTLRLVVNENIEKLTLKEYQTKLDRDTFALSDMKVLKEIPLSSYQVDLTYLTEFKWEVYCENRTERFNSNFILEDERNYYFRLLTQSAYENGTSQVLFDSKSIALSLNPDAVETGCLFQMIENYDDDTKAVTGGLCPQFYFKNCSNNFTVYNPRQNSSATLINDGQNFDMKFGCNGYSIEVKPSITTISGEVIPNTNTSALENILGVSKNTNPVSWGYTTQNNTNFNPNNYPNNRDLAGLTQLGSDRQRYNIEINLPIRAYNTTESTVNNLGQTRTILYNTNPVVEDVTNITAGLINGTIDPSNLKFLSLNNDNEIKLNHIDLKIRRAKNNELAEEIIDSSIEILIKSSK